MTREAFETALDAGHLQIRRLFRDGDHWYKVRRNGRTRTWKRQPDRFSIPIKYSFKLCLRIEAHHFNTGEVDVYFRINRD